MPATGLLALDGIGKRYTRGAREVVALEGISFELGPGELLGVLGEPRSGKTTLLRVASGIEVPDAGGVRFDGRDLTALTRRQRAAMLGREIGCVWTTHASLRSLSVVSHVALPLVSAGWSRPKARARAQELLRRVAADHCADGRLSELSASEQVRVSLAQALVRAPKLLLADEPTNTLNMIEREEILEIVRSVADDAGLAVLMTSGDASGIAADRLASLSRGRLLQTRMGGRGTVLDFPPRGERRGGGRAG